MSAMLLARRGAAAAAHAVTDDEAGGFVALADLVTDPMSDEVAPGFTVSVSGTAQSFTGATTTYWNSGLFNEQGQLWEAATAGNVADGCKNVTTGYHQTISSVEVPCSSVITVRTRVKNASKFTLTFISGAVMDFNIHIRPVGVGPLKRIQARPVKDTATGTRKVNIAAPSTGDWEIWCTASAYQISLSLPSQSFRFVGITHDGTASLERTPNTRVVIGDGDSWFHPCGAAVANTIETYRSFGIIDALEELTGWVFARVANGGTGWVTLPTNSSVNGIDEVTDGGASVFGSYKRRTYIERLVEQDGADIVAYLMNGTYNDGSKLNNRATMQGIVSTYTDFLDDLDPGLPVVCIGPEPYANWTVDAPTGPHNENRLGIRSALAAAPNRTRVPDGHDGFIDPAFNEAWFTGTGDEYHGGTGVQATIIGGDTPVGIHPNYAGVLMYAGRIFEALLTHWIGAARANGEDGAPTTGPTLPFSLPATLGA